MIINWYGHSCFKIQSGQLIIIIDPFDPSIGLRPPRGKADIVAVTHQHSDHNYTNSLDGGAFVVKGPGEYEIKGASIKGIASFHDDKGGKERGLNTIYLIKLEDMVLCHLGDLGQKLSNEQLEALNEVDILFVPVGGKYTLDGSEAAQTVHQIEPKIVIPMHYKLPGLKFALDGPEKFLKEMGVAETNKVPKLTIKKKDLPENTEIILMSLGA